MRIESVTVGPFVENCWLIVDETTQHAVLVDPGDEPDEIIAMVERSGATLDAIWLTHAHLDHVGAIAGVKRRWNVPVYMHPLDQPLLDIVQEQAELFGVDIEQPPQPERTLADGEWLTVGSLKLQVLHTPGHAPGHVIFVGDGVVIGGDLLFAGSIGRTDLPLADPRDMQLSLARIAELDPSLEVHPGHGPSTTIGDERATNPFLTGLARVVTR